MITMTWYNTVAVVVYILLLLWAKNIYDRPWRDYDVDGLLLSISWINERWCLPFCGEVYFGGKFNKTE